MRLRIREIRLAKGMTLKDVGDLIGRKPHSVWEYENNQTQVSACLLYAIAQALEVTVDELYEDAAPPPTPRAAVLALPPRRTRGSRAPH